MPKRFGEPEALLERHRPCARDREPRALNGAHPFRTPHKPAEVERRAAAIEHRIDRRLLTASVDAQPGRDLARPLEIRHAVHEEA